VQPEEPSRGLEYSVMTKRAENTLLPETGKWGGGRKGGHDGETKKRRSDSKKKEKTVGTRSSETSEVRVWGDIGRTTGEKRKEIGKSQWGGKGA